MCDPEVVSGAVVRIVVMLLAAGAWSWWDERRPRDPQADERDASLAARLVRTIVVMVVVLAVALLLAAWHVPGAAIVAMIALIAIMGLVYIGPFLGRMQRRRGRRRHP